MPITVPAIDDRRYDDLLNEAIARIPVHNPEWTNFNRSDPGITLVELFAFLAENVLYRANLIPERNRLKFLSLLGIPLRPASSAQGLVTFANDRGPLQTVALNSDLEVRAGQIPFRTEAALDVLPLEARVYYKRPVVLSSEDQEVYRRFYASVLEGEIAGTPALEPSAYETTVLDGSDPAGVDLADATAGAADASLWLALLARPQDAARLEEVRAAVAGKTLNVAIVPVVEDAGATLPPAGTGVTEGEANLEYATPNVPIGGRLPEKASDRIPRYLPLDARPAGPPGQPANVLLRPGVVQVTLPDPAGLGLWTNLEPIEEGTGQFPPAIEDSKVADRLVTW